MPAPAGRLGSHEFLTRPQSGKMFDVALTKDEQRKAADLIRQLLDLVDEGHLAVDGPAGVALVRHLEGAMLALTAMDSGGSNRQRG